MKLKLFLTLKNIKKVKKFLVVLISSLVLSSYLVSDHTQY